MNGDAQQLPADQNQGGGNWQFKPDDRRPAQPSATSPSAQPAQAPGQNPVLPPAGAQLQQQPPVSNPPQPSVARQDYNAVSPGQADTEISWTASEYVAHHRGTGWFLLLGVGMLAMTAGTYLLTRDIFSSVVILVILALVGVSATHKPRVLPYQLTNQGLSVGNRFYPYGQFKAFSIADEGAFSSITFAPMKRLSPPLSIYYDPADEDRIVAALSLYLPMELHKADAMESLTRRLRF